MNLLANITLLLLLVNICNCQTFDEFKAEMEEIVSNLTAEMDDIYTRRCEHQIATCEVFSYYECQGTAAKQCYTDFPKAAECVDEEVYLAPASAVRFPEEVNVQSLSNAEKEFVCTSALLEDSFKALDNNRNKRYGRAFIGTNLGSFRSYPATGGCHSYDPRFRPWYVSATAGAKNVILIIDVSGSMSGSRIGLAKDAAWSVVNTLSNSDFVGAVAFNSEAWIMSSDKIERATEEVKGWVSSAISGLSARGGTNFEDGIRKAFDLLNAAQRDEYGSPCTDGENIFLFLTDGEPNDGASSSQQLINIINSYNKQIRLFTYALGSGASTGILQDLACAFSGIMFRIDESSSTSLVTIMRNYYTFIAEGVQIDSPVWTEPYDDAFGLGRMVTVSMPIYYYENSIRTILGVVGLDVSMEQIYTFGLTEEETMKRLIGNGVCHSSNLTDCQIDSLRGSSCGVTNCPATGSIQECSSPPADIFLTPIENNGSICCGLTVTQLILIIVFSVIAFLIIVVVAGCCIRRKLKQQQEDYHEK